MAQTVFQYDYGQEKDAKKNAKRLSSHEFYTVVIYHPTKRRYLVLFCDTEADLPTRVPIIHQFRDKPPMQYQADDGDKWRALMAMIEQGVVLAHMADNGARFQREELEELADRWHNA